MDELFNPFLVKVYKIAKVKYELEEEVVNSRMFEIEQCYQQGYSPIRTVEVVADHLF